ncbi:MAG: hypothetical protein PHQ60_10060 [Sideroxydans sp.]|nr:hypothetical protein [Sideroxydans sp.]
MKPENPLGRHSGEGRNPAKEITLRSRQNQDFVPLRGHFLISWIPAFAGMTLFF